MNLARMIAECARRTANPRFTMSRPRGSWTLAVVANTLDNRLARWT